MKSVLGLILMAACSLAGTDLSGKWTGTYDVSVSDGDTMKGRVFMTLTQNGSEVSGKIGPDEQQQSPIAKGKIDGDRITFESQTEGPLMRFDLRLVDDHIRGEAVGDLQDTKIRAKVELARQQ
ncbi:MAG: hypothetical protein M3Y27_24100 [Acidobacteriota bacterium]|nr:hypothetical protein [Acidobacteriota bacterium]